MNSTGRPVNWPEMSSESDGTARNAERIVTLKSSGTSRGRQKAVHKHKGTSEEVGKLQIS